MEKLGEIERNILCALVGNKYTRDDLVSKTGYNTSQVSHALGRLKAHFFIADVGRDGKLKIYVCLDIDEDFFINGKPKRGGSGIITPAPYERGYRWWGGGGRLF